MSAAGPARILASSLATAVIAIFGAAELPSSATARDAPPTPLDQRVNLRPGLQLAAMRVGITAAASFFAGYDSHCTRVTPILAAEEGEVMAGNFRDQQSACYIWLNLTQSAPLNAQEICKLALHESGHLTGLQHSPDPNDVMYSPFRAKPIPPRCQKPLAAYSRAARARARRARAKPRS